MIQRRRSCFCAFCKNPRKVAIHKHLQVVDIIGLVVLSYVITLTLWQHPDPRGLFILACFVFSGEGLTQVRWRQSMICKNCGFDPVMYIKSPELAGLKIKEFMQVRFDKPEFLLKPAVKYPIRKAPSQSELSLRA